MSVALSEVARMIQRESGILLGPSQLPSLQAAIARVDRELTAEALLERAVSAETVLRLIDEVTIRETFFFRHRSELDAIEWYSLLASARAHGSGVVRVWVAGCASGEEAYTVAILACEAFACASPPVRVLATDIAPTALEQAIAGRYGVRAVRTLQGGVRERYFSNVHGVSCVSERLRALVEFRRHNLVRDPIPPAGEQPFDVILCRNVLIYFDRPTVEHILGALERALAPAGLLLLGAADRLSRQSLPISRVVRPSEVGPRALRAHASLPRVPIPPSRKYGTSTDIEHPSQSVGPPKRVPQRSPPTPAEAMKAADRGELDLAVQIAKDVLAENPLDSQAHFIRGVAEFAREDARAAVEPLRRALFIDPNFGLAAFKLACAHDALGELGSARRAYERTLRILDHCAAEQTARSDQLDLFDMAAACHTRLQELSGQLHSR
ncbi:MAG TPA: CheR family methyltransferase [Solirubrobacteraceae bacterium]|jgi:chemotaxis methyl-accepting protein methylase|nr:CheR family methyltransferase [Solirubrobacteraceae bacterium]